MKKKESKKVKIRVMVDKFPYNGHEYHRGTPLETTDCVKLRKASLKGEIEYINPNQTKK